GRNAEGVRHAGPGLSTAEKRLTVRIALNLMGLQPGRTGGIEIYARNLLAGLARLPHANDYRVLVSTEARGITPADDSRFSECWLESRLPGLMRKSVDIRNVWQWFAIAREIKRFQADVHHC